MDIDEAVMIEQGYPAGCGRCKALEDALWEVHREAARAFEVETEHPFVSLEWIQAKAAAVLGLR